jgi:hypothetical protein
MRLRGHTEKDLDEDVLPSTGFTCDDGGEEGWRIHLLWLLVSFSYSGVAREDGLWRWLVVLVPSSISRVMRDNDDYEGSRRRLLRLVMPPQSWSGIIGMWNRKRGVEKRVN